ncbi:MAG: M18 family aminopeptidase [Lachnospiraceae bacterium]
MKKNKGVTTNMDKKQSIDSLIETCNHAVSPYHMVKYGIEQLEAVGFEPLQMDTNWNLQKGHSYYVNVYGTTLAAFRINPDFEAGQQLRIATGHTDWPCLRIKNNASLWKKGYRRLNVEVYGGPIYNTWMDRPLSIAGKVTVAGDNAFHPKDIMIDFARPVITIPNLAIHFNREANTGFALNQQNDLVPLMGIASDDDVKYDWFMDVIAEEAKVKRNDILGFDLYVYVYEKACLAGLKEEYISSPRLDNVTSCQSCLHGIINGTRKTGIDAIMLFDNEECGSRSKQGADSSVFPMMLEKLAISLGLNREEYINLILGGFAASLDVAHAIHPAHPEKCDLTNTVVLGNEIAFKLESNQRYASDSSAVGVLEGLCRKYHLPYKVFFNRSDVRGGSTLGSILSANLPMKIVDLGVPLLAMHSARELMGAESQFTMDQLMIAYFTEE